MLDDRSAEIRPQDDLVRHVNGAWLERTEIPDDKARWGSFHLIAEQAEKDVRAIVEESQDAERVANHLHVLADKVAQHVVA